MKILIIAPYPVDGNASGGAENHIRNLVHSLIKEPSIDLHVITLSQHSSSKIVKGANLTIHTIKEKKIPMTFAGISLYPFSILKKAKEIAPDIVHGQMVGAPYGLATALLSHRFPSVLTIHTFMDQKSAMKRTFFEKVHDFIWQVCENYELKKIPFHIVVSPHLKDKVIKKGGENVLFLPNGIENKWFNVPTNSIEGRLLFVGRINPIKGLEHLIKAVSIARKEGFDINVHIVGPFEDNKYRTFLFDLCSKLDVSDYITFTGSLYEDALLTEYSEASIFVLPSFDESNPIVLLESLAVGIPIVATNVGGIPYLVKDGVNGFLVDFGDEKNMAQIIIEIVKNKKILNTISVRNKKDAENYRWDEITSKTIEFYHEICYSASVFANGK